MEEIIVGSEVLLKNEKDSRESMLVAEIIDNYAKCVWRDVNDVPQQKSYPIALLKLKPLAKAGYAAASGGGSRSN